jgi:hypothetical protein
MWRLRLIRELPRLALYVLAGWGLLASARYAIAPPRQATPHLPVPERLDRPAEAFAVLFARRYLTWNAARPQAYEESLAPFLGEGSSEAAGVGLPQSGSEETQWAEVVQERRGASGARVYTVACQTDTAGLVYVSVSVSRDASGALELDGNPALVGAPIAAPARDIAEGFQDVAEPALQTVVTRALRNFLAGSASNLAADIAAGAQIALPGIPLTLEALDWLKWLPGGGSVYALVQAVDHRGARYALEYELDVAQLDGRWEISAIQTNPDN